MLYNPSDEVPWFSTLKTLLSHYMVVDGKEYFMAGLHQGNI